MLLNWSNRKMKSSLLNLDITGEVAQHRFDVVDAAEVSEDGVRKVESDANSAKVEGYKHVPDMVYCCEGFYIFFVWTVDRSAVLKLSPGETTNCFHLKDT